MNMRISTPDTPQHSLLKSLGFHVLPGVATTVAVLVFKPLLDPIGYPPLLAYLLAVLLVDLPVLLAVMLYEGKKRNGRYNLKGVVLYREKLPWKTFALIFVGASVVIYALMMLVIPLSNLLGESVFSWLPDWMFLEEQTQYQAYAKNVLLVTFSLHLVLTGVALPWVEEMYFRGTCCRVSRAMAGGRRCWVGCSLGCTTSGSCSAFPRYSCWERRWGMWCGGSGTSGSVSAGMCSSMP
jgi:hypothetical protein